MKIGGRAFAHIAQFHPELTALRRDLHAHPELGFEEHYTSARVKEALRLCGVDEIHEGLGCTGVVGVIHGQTRASGAMVGLRADMDALPITEDNEFPWKSCKSGLMHGCGHDGHTAMLVGAARYLAETRRFDGTAVLVFQPGEEGFGGARVMMEDGLFERFPMQAVFGMHNWPGMAAGTMAVSAGPVMASTSEFKITVRGKGCHAAMPHLGADPVVAACQMVLAFQNIISRNKKPLDTAVISVTMVHAGEVSNVVPDTCELQGTVRTFTTEVLDLIEQRMRQVAEHTCAAFATQCDFEFVRNYPPTINSPAEAAFARQVMQGIVGPERVLEQEPTLGGEDFAYMLQAKPGAYCFIANGEGGHRSAGHDAGPCTLHNPSYDFNDELIPLGATYWVQLAQQWLAQR